MNPETIVALSTPAGRGGIGIVRLSGSEAARIAAPLVKLRHELAAGQARFGQLVDEDGGTLDEVVVTLFAAPHSYTGEDVVEVAAHGSPVVLDAIVRRCLASGARLARPGEFTERAFLAGRMDLTQAEAVNDLIHAQTLHQAQLAAQQMEGALSRRIQPIKQAVVELIAELEAGIDFAEDDMDVMPATAIAQKLAVARTALAELSAGYTYGRMVRDGITLAIVGRPNVGKSSLFNRLVEHERAIVTASPGTTRDTISHTVAIHGIPVELMDTAGLRETADEAEELGVARSREAMADAAIVLLVLDASAPPHSEDAALRAKLADRPHLIVANKCDLANATAHNAANELHASALTGAGIEDLRQAILRLAGGGALHTESGLVTTLRQHEAIQSALDATERAESAATQQTPHEMLLLDAYTALRSLDALTGATTADDVLSLIFSRFCIGK